MFQILVLSGGQKEEDYKPCENEFSKFSGSFPEEVFSKGFNFSYIGYFKIIDKSKLKESIFIRASNDKFIRIFSSGDLDVYIDPESRLKYEIGDNKVIYFFTRYFVAKFLKDHVCLYSFKPKGD
jgi:hypothetical protein